MWSAVNMLDLNISNSFSRQLAPCSWSSYTVFLMEPIFCTIQWTALHCRSWIAMNCCSEILWIKKFLFSVVFVHQRLPLSGVEQELFEACWPIIREIQSLAGLGDTKASSLVWHYFLFCLFRATAVCRACIMRSSLFRMLYSPSWTRRSYAFSVYWTEYVE